MVVGGKFRGVLSVWNKQWGSGFSEQDERVLLVLAMQAAQLLENARLREGERELRLVQEELLLASRIQRDLLPKSPPHIPGYSVCAATRSAAGVGGDYFDFVHLDRTSRAICLGDVCGKGLPAALLMANLQAIVRTQALYEPPGDECHTRCQSRFAQPAKLCMERSNRLLYHSTTAERFVTFFYGILDTERHTLRFSNAGHNPPLLWHHGEVTRLTDGGIPLAVLEDWTYEEKVISMAPGSLLLMYSDGVTEALSPSGEEFGEDQLVALMKEMVTSPGEQILSKVFDAVEGHTQTVLQQDDMTLLLLRREGT
jgi:sigma-B regulation protein RsbU (phosphoserine phosphatase)